MSKTLVIVESPAKARTIGRFLGSNIQVQASMGHVRDLPSRSLGVDIAHDFQPQYELTANGKRVMKGLKSLAADANQIYLATDPDREGEAIAWHLQEVLKGSTKAPFHRITFHEITKSAIDRSLQHPGQIADDLVSAQQARRVLDRIVGYQVSPLLWRRIKKHTSAGRVQSVALRLVVEREREIQAFKPEEYWNLDALFGLDAETKLKTRLMRVNGDKAQIHSEQEATLLANALESPGVQHKVALVSSKPRVQSPAPPFITSTLQQACGSSLHLGASQTMRIAQELYEGVDIGNGGPVGLITYMRTDSVNIAKEAQDQARAYIGSVYGAEYVPAKPNIYRSRQTAQEAHEAIRPTDVTRTPESVAAYLTPQQLKVYRIVWNRFVASQMASARQIDHVIEIESAGGALASLVFPPTAKSAGTVCRFKASARETVFQGYLRVYNLKDLGDETDEIEAGRALPPVSEGMPCTLLELLKTQNFTTPPNRYTEASLVKALEVNGVGRPSTFATTVNTIQEREYVSKEKGSLVPTQLGFQVNDFLVERMPELFDIGFTSQMEAELDHVEDGTRNWIQMLKEFYEKFQTWQGAHQSAPVSPEIAEKSKDLLGIFPDGFEFNPPVKNGRRVYDDGKFLASVQKQQTSGKELSDKQIQALYHLIARYWDKIPEIETRLQQLGVLADVLNVRKEIAETEARVAQKASAVTECPAELEKLLNGMSNINWSEPVKRGKRVYDDGKFFNSLKEQAEAGKALTVSQMSALLKLAARYANVIENYAELVTALGGEPAKLVPADENTTDADSPKKRFERTDALPKQEADSALAEEITALLKAADGIRQWREPTTSRGRTFNDRDFINSLRQQFAKKGTLSDKQVAALKKVLGKYESDNRE